MFNFLVTLNSKTNLNQYNYLYIPLLCWIGAQCIKGFIAWEKTSKFSIKSFLASGGMPSSHTSFITGLIVCLGEKEGVTSPVFAIAFCFGIIVAYDAFNVRLHAGKGIKLSKSIINSLQQKGIKVEVKDKKIKEVLGHRKIEVGGGVILGLAISLLIITFLG